MIYNDDELQISVDPYNLKNKRTTRNTFCRLYNCGGYALDTMSWYLPCDYGFDYGYATESENIDIIMECSKAMLAEFSDLRAIKDVKELKKDEYAIAFRLAYQYDDFHFMKRGKNGVWYEKRGGSPNIYPVSKKVVFSKSWHNKYYGKIVLFAKKYKKPTKIA